MKSIPKLPGEFDLIARYFAPLAAGFSGAYRLRDDAAVISAAPGCELVATTDAIVAGVDFPSDEAADLVARKALRVNLSDLAAKGAVPRGYMVDLMLPDTVEEAWIAAFAAGLGQDQAEYAVHLIGGDMSSTPGPAAVAVTAFGEVPVGRIIRRGGARAGDAVFITGTIGDAAFGLAVLRGELPDLDPELAAFLIDRYRLPQPRVTLGPPLIGVATAALDVSDGLLADLRHLCEASGLAAVIEAPRIPLSPAARRLVEADPSGRNKILGGGDDYEILLTAPEAAADQVARLSQRFGIPITRIGHMAASRTRQARIKVLDAAGRPMALSSEGWAHFR